MWEGCLIPTEQSPCTTGDMSDGATLMLLNIQEEHLAQ